MSRQTLSYQISSNRSAPGSDTQHVRSQFDGRRTRNTAAVPLLAASVVIKSTAAPTTDSAEKAGLDSAARCASLTTYHISASAIGLPTRGAIVTKTKLVPAGLPSPFGEYCLIEANVQSVDSHAQSITFSAALPTHWNGKVVQLGDGGYEGQVVSPTDPSSHPRRTPSRAAAGKPHSAPLKEFLPGCPSAPIVPVELQRDCHSRLRMREARALPLEPALGHGVTPCAFAE